MRSATLAAAAWPDVGPGVSLAPWIRMPNPLIHWELMVSDVARTKAFLDPDQIPIGVLQPLA